MDRARTILSSLFHPSSSASGEPSGRRRSRRIDNNNNSERDNQQQQQQYNVNTFFESIFTDPLSAMFGVDTNHQNQQQHFYHPHHQGPPGWQQFHHDQHNHPGQPNNNNRVPPVSNTVLRNLPVLTITKDDLIDPTNRQCAICMEDIQLQQRVIRLIPYCGHTFCSWDCIRPWLLKQATCPICRYELPTDAGPEYEMSRQTRMSYRKPRLSKYDLQHRLSISQLKQLLSLHQLRNQPQQQSSRTYYKNITRQQQQQQKSNNNNTSFHFTEKQEIIDHILQADDEYVDWIAMPEPVKYTVSDLQKMSISQLKHVMNHEAGVYFENQKDIVEKSDMLQYFILSGRLQIIPNDDDNNDDNNDDDFEDIGNKENGLDSGNDNAIFGTSSQAKSLRKDRTMVVETVDEYDDDDNHDVSDPQREVPSLDSREDPTLLMEENLNFTVNNNNEPISDHDFLMSTSTTTGAVVQTEHYNENQTKPQDDIKLNDEIREISDYNSDTDQIEVGTELDNSENASITDINNHSRVRNESAVDLILNHNIEDSTINYDTPATNNDVNDNFLHGADAAAEKYDSVANAIVLDPYESNEHTSSAATAFATGNGSNYNTETRQTHNSTPQSMQLFQDRSITELKALAQALRIDISGCLERREIVQCLVTSISNRNINNNHSNSTVASNTESIDLSILESEIFDIHETRLLTMLLGIDVAHCYNCKDSMLVTIYEAVKDRSHQIRFLQSLEPIARARTITDLHTLARKWKVNIDQCIEKREIVQRLIISKY